MRLNRTGSLRLHLALALLCSMTLLACGGGGGGGEAVTPAGDTTPPVISVDKTAISDTSVAITWLTDEGATSEVTYGQTAAYDATTEDLTIVTSHRIVLTGLTPSTEYHYQIVSEDEFGNVSATADKTFTTTADPAPITSAIESDEFDGASLDGTLWTTYDPVGNSIVSVNGTQLQITVPAGSAHDAWEPNFATRLMQPAPDKDFQVEVKFDSQVAQRYQDQGIMVEQSGTNWLRFDVYSNGTEVKMYAASIVDGITDVKVDKTITPPSAGESIYLLVTRTDDDWDFSYSFDGTNYNSVITFSHALTVNAIGPYAGNYSLPATDPIPAFTALVDYFHNTAAP